MTRGDHVIIARAGVPVARSEPVEPVPARRFGTMDFRVPPAFFEELPEDELQGWE